MSRRQRYIGQPQRRLSGRPTDISRWTDGRALRHCLTFTLPTATGRRTPSHQPQLKYHVTNSSSIYRRDNERTRAVSLDV